MLVVWAIPFVLCVSLFWLLYNLISGQLKVSRKFLLRMGTVLGAAALVFGGVYALHAVTCAVRSRHDVHIPKPYDVARDEVYSAFLEDIAADSLLLVQDDTHPWMGDVSTGYRTLLGMTPEDKKLQKAADEATQDYGRRNGPMLIDGRFTLSTSYQMVSRSTAVALLGFRKHSEVCKPFKEGGSILVFLSPVGFNSDQTFAGIDATVLSVCTGNYGARGWSGARMFQKECGKWVPVKSGVFGDSAIGLVRAIVSMPQPG